MAGAKNTAQETRAELRYDLMGKSQTFDLQGAIWKDHDLIVAIADGQSQQFQAFNGTFSGKTRLRVIGKGKVSLILQRLTFDEFQIVYEDQFREGHVVFRDVTLKRGTADEPIDARIAIDVAGKWAEGERDIEELPRLNIELVNIGPAGFKNLGQPARAAQITESFPSHANAGLLLELKLRAVIAVAGLHEASLRVTGSRVDGLTIGNSFLNGLTLLSPTLQLEVHNSILLSPNVRSQCFHVSLDNVLLVRGDFLPANLSSLKVETPSKFDGTRIEIASLENACFDRSNLDLRSARVFDQWHELRDTYTGARFFLNLLLLLVYFLPLIARALSYAAFAAVEQATHIEGIAARFHLEVEHSTVWELLFFGTSQSTVVRLGYFALSVAVLVYQGLRLHLTIAVSALREREEHLDSKGYKASRPSADGVRKLYRLHGVMMFLLVIALLSLLWRALEVLMLPVVLLR